MNIKDTRTNSEVEFKELKWGDVFRVGNSRYYMRVSLCYIGCVAMNAVDICSGSLVGFDEDTLVQLVEHELIIKS